MLWVFHHPRAMGRSPLARGPCLSSCPTSPAREHHRAERGGRGSIAPPTSQPGAVGPRYIPAAPAPAEPGRATKAPPAKPSGNAAPPGIARGRLGSGPRSSGHLGTYAH